MLVYSLVADVPTIKEVFDFLLPYTVGNKQDEPTVEGKIFITNLNQEVNFKFMF